MKIFKYGAFFYLFTAGLSSGVYAMEAAKLTANPHNNTPNGVAIVVPDQGDVKKNNPKKKTKILCSDASFYLDESKIQSLNSPVLDMLLRNMRNNQIPLPEIYGNSLHTVLRIHDKKALERLITTLTLEDTYLQKLMQHHRIVDKFGLNSAQLQEFEAKESNKVPKDKNDELAQKIDKALDFLGLTLPDFSNNLTRNIIKAVGDQIPVITTEYAYLEGNKIFRFLVDKDLIIAGFKDGSLTIHDRTTKQMLKRLVVGEKPIAALAVNNKYVFVSSGGLVNVINKKSYENVAQFNDFPNTTWADDKILVCGNNDGTLTVYDLVTYKCTTTLKIGNPVRCIAMHNNELYSGSDDGIIRKWDIVSSKCVQHWDCDRGSIYMMAVNDQSFFVFILNKKDNSKNGCFVASKASNAGNKVEFDAANWPGEIYNMSPQLIDNCAIIVCGKREEGSKIIIRQTDNLSKKIKKIDGKKVYLTQVVDGDKIALIEEDTNSIIIHDLSAFLSWNKYITKELSFAHQFVLGLINAACEYKDGFKLELSEWQMAVVQDMYDTIKQRWGKKAGMAFKTIVLRSCVVDLEQCFVDV